MADQKPQRGVLLALAAEGMVPVLGGCAGALAGGPEAGMLGGLVGVAVGQAVEKVINFFGARIVHRWGEWFRAQPIEVQQQALADLASMSPEEARSAASDLIDRLSLQPLSPADKDVAVSYLSLLPGALDRALPRDAGGQRSLPPNVSTEEPQHLLSLLPVSLPPYPIGTEVPGTPYRLDAILGSGGFGAVYRASTRTLQHLPLAIKFCLDPTLVKALHRERENLERLMRAGGQDWSPRVVRLYGYDLEHKTPYLVYEFVTGGDLIRWMAERREKLGRPLNPGEVRDLIVQVAEALSFAHEHGLVHRDLKPANILVEGGVLKLADFGLGGVNAARAAQVSRIGATTVDLLSVADQASLFRGAGTPLYMAPEQRRGQAPDPRHDLYSLGVLWYQLLVGDVSRELHPGWAKELKVRYAVPREHIDLIEACVGWFEERPKTATELLHLMRQPAEASPIALPVSAPPPPVIQPLVTPASPPSSPEVRESLRNSILKQLVEAHARVTDSSNLWYFWWVALVVWVPMFAWSEGRFGAFLSMLFATFLAAVGVFIGYVYMLGKHRDARDHLAHLIGMLKAEFPDDVRTWGGDSVLHNPDLVTKLALQLGAIELKQVAVGHWPTLDAHQRKQVQGRLQQLAEKVEAVETRSQPKPFPLFVALLVGLALGVAAGVGSGMAYAAYKEPTQGYSFRGEPLFYSASGEAVSQGAYAYAQRSAAFTGTILGLTTGLAVAIVLAVWLTRKSWHRGPMIVGLVIGLVIGPPLGVGAGALTYQLGKPMQVHGEGKTQYLSSKGRDLKEGEYRAEENRAAIAAVVVGVLVGLLGAVTILQLYLRWYARHTVVLQQEVQQDAKKLADDYPAVIAACGGVEALTRGESLAALLQTSEAGKSGS